MADREATKEIVLHASGAETVTGVSETFWVPQSVAVAYLDVTASSGGTELLDVVLQEVNPADSTKVFTIATWTQATGVTNEREIVNPLLGCYVRAQWTIAGTTPSFTFSLHLQLKES